jgi:hypothetical protein
MPKTCIDVHHSTWIWRNITIPAGRGIKRVRFVHLRDGGNSFFNVTLRALAGGIVVAQELCGTYLENRENYVHEVQNGSISTGLRRGAAVEVDYDALGQNDFGGTHLDFWCRERQELSTCWIEMYYSGTDEPQNSEVRFEFE